VTALSGLEQASFEGRRVLVLGLGRFSGGVETVRFLHGEGATVRVSDNAERAQLLDSARAVESLGVDLHFGAQTESLLAGQDVVLANPALPFDHPVLEAARGRGIPITTEINVVLARSPAPVYAVTGTKGKSTTASLLARMLEAAGRTVHLGGNIGRSLVAGLGAVRAEDCVVLELSSFQLWWTRGVERSPQVTVVTNLLSDHLDRHGTQAEYAAAKRAALDYQRRTDVAVLPADDEAVRAAGWHEAGAARRVLYGRGGRYRMEGTQIQDGEGEAACDLAGLPLLGAHNLRNALAAASAVLATQVQAWAAVRDGALAARPLPHRLDPVAEIGGVQFLDDSNATHPHSTLCALAAIDRPIVLIAGGKEKGIDSAPLMEGIRRRVKALVAIGSTTPKLMAALEGDVPVVDGGPDMTAAVRAAVAQADPGDVVLLSPGFSSLDQYTSFAERGDRFRAVVRALEG
jgi:UDP-N-acetylmuramoylalanine--D-glutamate ligase